MPETVNDLCCRPCCFSGIDSRNIKYLTLISFRRLRAQHQSILRIVSSLLDELERKTARLPAVVSLFQFGKIEQACSLRPFSRCFRCNNSENSGAGTPAPP